MRHRRTRIAGGTYFFTVVAHERRPVLTDPALPSALRTAFRREHAARKLRLDAIVVLPDHPHRLWTMPPGEADSPGAWRRTKAAVSRAADAELDGPLSASRRAKGERGIWQRRYWEHAIRDEDDLRRHLDCVRFNPVRHGLATSPAAWPHSSFHRFVQRGPYPEDWAGDPGHIARE